MLLPAHIILKSRQDQQTITNELLSVREAFKWCTLTNIVFLDGQPIIIIDSNSDLHVRNGILIFVKIQLNSDHSEYQSLRRDLIRIKSHLLEKSDLAIKAIRIIPTIENYFLDQMNMYQVLNDELEMDKLIDELISSVKGVIKS